MIRERRTNPDVADFTGSATLPRKSGELVFNAEWERRAFALALDLVEKGFFEWSDFQAQLIRAVAEAESNDPQNPSRGYYESWLAALEALIEEKNLLDV